jgi:DNA-binding MarR family transcriptional regulator
MIGGIVMSDAVSPVLDSHAFARAKHIIAELADLLGVGVEVSPQPVVPQQSYWIPGDPDSRAQAARTWIRVRRAREKLLGADLFADPAWDMLLDLYIEHKAGRSPSVSSLCLASQVPVTTALRWISKLEHDGLITRSHDPKDGRRIYVHLAPSTVDSLDRVIDSFIGSREPACPQFPSPWKE